MPESHPSYSKLTTEIKLPDKEVVLAARDDTAQYDTESTIQDFDDDPDIVVNRRMNKLTFVIHVKPLITSGTVTMGFQLKYKYKAMTPSIRPEEQKDPEDVNVMPCVTVVLGSI